METGTFTSDYDGGRRPAGSEDFFYDTIPGIQADAAPDSGPAIPEEYGKFVEGEQPQGQ